MRMGQHIDKMAFENATVKYRLDQCATIVQRQYDGVRITIKEIKRKFRGKEFTSEFKVYYSVKSGGVQGSGRFDMLTTTRQDVLVLLKHFLLKLLFKLIGDSSK